ncbi:hypothetical protein [Streptomyces flavofungini]|uniref:hypothetical protein n=1 Tax=Streptomyces flavofungini TaxID=68200 RepID=UPI0034DECD7C
MVALAANIVAAPALAWRPVLVAGWPPVALLLAVELLAHAPDGGEGQTAEARVEADGGSEDDQEHPRDPMVIRALRLDQRNWQTYRRPISAESLREERGTQG